MLVSFFRIVARDEVSTGKALALHEAPGKMYSLVSKFVAIKLCTDPKENPSECPCVDTISLCLRFVYGCGSRFSIAVTQPGFDRHLFDIEQLKKTLSKS